MAMTLKDRIYLYTWDLTPEAPLCINCKHFRQHYILGFYRPGYCTPIDCGHCIYPRMKPRKAYDTCQHFDKKNDPSGRDANPRAPQIRSGAAGPG